MLELKNITKIYQTGSYQQTALKEVSIQFRKQEFVSILGQSGGGKTTLLNIIGGLDRYTSGDLIINGKSTKQFKDKEWDAYRNYSVGFVFQSYNLIPHQTILSNVELALTLSGVSKKERKQRAIAVLEEVGLGEQIHKKPNQLSGGQMQRVAIARALVNNPDIILADEPTGALDSTTSVQIMEILKKISKDKLIIMVTHNPELAEKYSTRVVKIRDGSIIEDSDPYTEKEEAKEKKIGRTSMKFFTALRLSLNNLMTKKGRTLLTAFAGSIGIIGIALIIAISNGIQGYINKVEEDTLSSYPITIEESTIDMSSLLQSLMGTEEKEVPSDGKVYSRDIINTMLTTFSSKLQTNNLSALKEFIDNREENAIVKNASAITYSYDVEIPLYNADTSNGIVRVNPSTVMETLGMGNEQNSMMQYNPMVSVSSTDICTELLDNEELLHAQYDVVAGQWPTKYNEVVLVLDGENEISDYTLYALGLKDQKELEKKWNALQEQEKIEEEQQTTYSYEKLLNISLKLLNTTDYYQKVNTVWLDKSEDADYMKQKIEEAEEIKIVGIIKQNKDSVATKMSSGIGYLKDLKEYVIQKNNEQAIVKEQKDNPEINVFTGIKFPTTEEEKTFHFENLSAEQKKAMQQMSSEQLAKVMEAYTSNQNASYRSNLKKLGSVEIQSPSSISIYPKDFEAKEAISKALEDYNTEQKNNQKEENEIHYTDMVGTMLNSVTQIINTISYALIGFIAISLIVSSIMIGIITYISVLERTKEIGILRAIGASKKDISRVFNAETFIIGFISGLIGIGITTLLTFPINSVITALSGVHVTSSLPVVAAIILVGISMFLTIVAGFIPAKMASKKDPVEALRTE